MILFEQNPTRLQMHALKTPATPQGAVNDLALIWEEGQADIILDGETVLMEGGLVSAVLVSMFSDARAPEDSGLAGADPRGWWPDDATDRHGSLLWLLTREKITPETLSKAKTWTEDALSWLVQDGIAERVGVEVERLGLDRVGIGVSLLRGKQVRWQHLWDALEEVILETGLVTLQVTPAV